VNWRTIITDTPKFIGELAGNISMYLSGVCEVGQGIDMHHPPGA
jgi:hypothetical protein